MRLSILDNGHHWKQKIPLSMMKLYIGLAPGPVLISAYRRDFFGDAFNFALDETLRDATQWTKGEVELFAAFVSNLNKCNY